VPAYVFRTVRRFSLQEEGGIGDKFDDVGRRRFGIIAAGLI
jgi:hypothetical protein